MDIIDCRAVKFAGLVDMSQLSLIVFDLCKEIKN